MNSKSKLSKITSSTAHRNILKRNMLTNLIVNEHITTTKAKADTLIGFFDEVVNYANKQDELSAKRFLGDLLYKEEAVDKVLTTFKERFDNETGGYLLAFKLENRKGDNAPMVKLMVKGYEYKGIGQSNEPAVKKSKSSKGKK